MVENLLMKEINNDIYIIKPYKLGDIDCSVYLIDTKDIDGLISIDPGLYIEPIKNIRQYGFNPKNIKHCLITHGHLDHFGVCYKLKKINPDINYYIHKLDAEKVEQIPYDDNIENYYKGFEYKPVKITKKLQVDNEILKFGDYEIKCIHIPGHTPGSVAYYLETDNSKIIFGGDICGATLQLSGGDLTKYIKSMQKLLELDIDILCDGHLNVIKPAEKVIEFIQICIKMNKYLHIILEEEPNNIKVWYDLTLLEYELGLYDNALDFCNYLLEINPNNSEAKELLKKIKKHNPPKFEFVKNYIKKYFGNQINSK